MIKQRKVKGRERKIRNGKNGERKKKRREQKIKNGSKNKIKEVTS
jgi:hypothetical protein